MTYRMNIMDDDDEPVGDALSEDQMAEVLEQLVGDCPRNIIDFLWEHEDDGSSGAHESEVVEEGVIVETEFATYEVPLTEDLFEYAEELADSEYDGFYKFTGTPDGSHDDCIISIGGAVELETPYVALPQQIREIVRASPSIKWAEEHGNWESPAPEC